MIKIQYFQFRLSLFIENSFNIFCIFFTGLVWITVGMKASIRDERGQNRGRIQQ